MPLFTYKALQEDKKIVEQTIQARDQDEIVTTLRSKGMKVLSVKKVGVGSRNLGGRISTLEKANFCRYLSVMLRAGLSIAESVELIASESDNPKMKQILQDLMFTMQEGGEISTSLQKYPAVFDPVFLALVRAGEQSGSLEKTFQYLADQIYSVHRLNKKIQGAMMYPAVIFCAMGGVGVLMMTFVLPRLSSAFSKMNMPLPLPTKILLGVGDFMGKNTLLVLASLGAIIGLFVFLFSFYKTKRFISSHIVNMPVINKLTRQIDLARFTRTLATLLQSGVPIVSALSIASETLSQYDMLAVAKTFEKEIMEGKTLASILSTGKKVFPSLMIQTIKTGEKTGTLDTILMELSDYYEEELEDALKEFTTILEPVIMLVIGVAVGAMVVMIIGPIYSIMGNMQTAAGGMPK